MNFTFRYDYTSHTLRATNKGSVVGNPLGKFAVEASNTHIAIGIIRERHNASDKRPVSGKSLLKDGKVLPVALGTHVRLASPYKGGDHTTYDKGVVVEVLEGNRYGVHLYRLGLTNAQDRFYTGSPDNPTTVDFSAKELVGVPKPSKFALKVKLAEPQPA